LKSPFVKGDLGDLLFAFDSIGKSISKAINKSISKANPPLPPFAKGGVLQRQAPQRQSIAKAEHRKGRAPQRQSIATERIQQAIVPAVTDNECFGVTPGGAAEGNRHSGGRKLLHPPE
jgi:hypothetical protein